MLSNGAPLTSGSFAGFVYKQTHKNILYQNLETEHTQVFLHKTRF